MGIHEEVKKKINAKEQGAFTCSVEGMRLINCWTNAHKELSKAFECQTGCMEGLDVCIEKLQKENSELRKGIEEACEVMEEECKDVSELACNKRITCVGFYREEDGHYLTEEEWCKWCKMAEKLRSLVKKEVKL